MMILRAAAPSPFVAKVRLAAERAQQKEVR